MDLKAASAQLRKKQRPTVVVTAPEENGIPVFEDTVERARRSGAWDRIGALKRQLLDDITTERNAFAKSVMEDVKDGQREKRAEK